MTMSRGCARAAAGPRPWPGLTIDTASDLRGSLPRCAAIPTSSFSWTSCFPPAAASIPRSHPVSRPHATCIITGFSSIEVAVSGAAPTFLSSPSPETLLVAVNQVVERRLKAVERASQELERPRKSWSA